MTDRPIIFSGPMVRAILDGRKTMTRRLVTSPLRKCNPGDRLWVREALIARNLDFSGALGLTEPLTKVDPSRDDLCISYAADNEHAVEEHGFDLSWQWKRLTLPAMHMPRGASRITLEVTGVKVERVQAITPDDAIAEGIPDPNDSPDPVQVFAAIWNSLHGPGSWAVNPEVIAISFRKITPCGGKRND